MRRLQRLDALVDVAGGKRPFDPARDVAVVERAPEVPARVEGLGVDLPERQVIAEPQQGLGPQDVLLREQRRGRSRPAGLPREVVEQRQEVIRGIQSVRGAVGDGAAQVRGVLAHRPRPGGRRAARRIPAAGPGTRCACPGCCRPPPPSGYPAPPRSRWRRGRRSTPRAGPRPVGPQCGRDTQAATARIAARIVRRRFVIGRLLSLRCVGSCFPSPSGRRDSTCRCWRRTAPSRGRCSRPRRSRRC